MRQSCDNDSEYEHIPRDAEGNPRYLILPDGVRTSYNRKMARLEAGWLATGDPLAISEAHTLTRLHRQVSPLWLDEAISSIVSGHRAPIHGKRAHEADVRLRRYRAVCDARENGLSWDDAYVEAERVLATDPAARAAADTMKKAYQAVKLDLKAGRGGSYFTRHRRRRFPAPFDR